MRIAFVVHGYPPEESAGVELVAQDQAQALAARGHEVFVFARGYDAELGSGVDEQIVAGIRVRRVRPSSPPHSFIESVENDFFDAPFRAFLDEVRPDLVHVQHLVMLSFSLLRVAHDAGLPCVLSLHDSFFTCHRLFLLDRDGHRCAGPDAGARCEACLADLGGATDARARFDAAARALAIPDAVLVPSRALGDRYLAEMPFLRDRLSVVDPGVRPLPAAAFDDGRRTRPAGAPVRFAFIGTWLPHKGLDVLIDASQAIDRDRFHLAVYGESVAGGEEYVAELRRRSASLPVDWHGRFVAGDLPRVLAAADVLVLPSRCDESYSRVVREARAAGLAVVASAAGGPAEVLRDEVDALLVAPGDREALARALQRLIAEPALLERLAAGKTAWPTTADAAIRLEEIYARCRASARERDGTIGRRPRVTVAYVTKNGRPWLEESLRAVRAQRGPFELVEILAVDSGSSDGSLEVLEAAGARVVRVPPETFGHGRTRNLAAREARGDVVAFLTQDATPADDGWLAALIAPLAGDPLLAGVWSRHLPRSDCHPMERRTIEEFPLFAGPPLRVAAARGNPQYAAHPELFVWFSNNASAFPRSVLLRWPFPDVEFAEDQGWARLVLEAGFRTALANESRIFHSHAYSAWANLQRNFDHSRAMTSDLGRVDDLSLAGCVRAAVSETRRDVAFWADRAGLDAARVAARLGPRALAYHLGAFGGRWLGARARRLPPNLSRWLSLHERQRAAR